MAYPRFQKARDFKFARRTSGDLTLNSATWANVDTGLDLTLNSVSVGDVIEYMVSLSATNGAVAISFDVATIVGGNPVTHFGSRAAPDNATYGFLGWRCQASVYQQATGSAWYALQAGDISSGSVTLRFRYRTDTATNKGVQASTVAPLDVFARNLGPVDPN